MARVLARRRGCATTRRRGRWGEMGEFLLTLDAGTGRSGRWARSPPRSALVLSYCRPDRTRVTPRAAGVLERISGE